MKIAFVWYWERASEIYPNWRDGLRAAVEEISKKHQVAWFFNKKIPDPKEKWDGIIFWDDSNSRFFQYVENYTCPIGICLTTDPHNLDNLRKVSVVYCESQPVYDAVRRQGIRAVKAFGTDTDFFKPEPEVKKDIEYFYPATFSPWKRQSDIAYLGKRLLCVGTIQPDGWKELEACLKTGVKVEDGYFPAEKIKNYYQRAKKVVIPAVHGSERTVLESMACDILPEVANNNVKARSYVNEYNLSAAKSPRQFVLRNYTHVKYAKNLLKGLGI